MGETFVATHATAAGGTDPAIDADVLVVGAGVTGIYQLYLAREAGFSVLMLEAGAGVGGTWYWNRYPGSRYDSESYTYGYFFSRELFNDWTWPEVFTGQAESERYFNHVVDRFDLRRHIRFDARVVAEDWDEGTGSWTVRTADGSEVRARFVVNATGVLSAPVYPQVPGREDFRGIAHHTGLWPEEPVEFAGKRVAVVGTGSSGVQVIPAIADEVASLTVYQRTPNWCVPLNNRVIPAEEQARIKADFERIREIVTDNDTGFLHVPHDRATFDDTREQRWAFYETIWRAPGFAKLTTNYTDLFTDRDANAEWCAFLEEKYRGIVQDPATVEKLIPRDHLYAGKRPPFVTGYLETFNRPDVDLVDLRETPLPRPMTFGRGTTSRSVPSCSISASPVPWQNSRKPPATWTSGCSSTTPAATTAPASPPTEPRRPSTSSLPKHSGPSGAAAAWTCSRSAAPTHRRCAGSSTWQAGHTAISPIPPTSPGKRSTTSPTGPPGSTAAPIPTSVRPSALSAAATRYSR
ncbi:flavin-containing monooxygenase [Nocardia sp. alder85J]|uniref:flavin-containing monooxygenase n=1 Tax=Nocardia sp. alder85J TaxID=2862949 RepID=UPI002250076A|nr:NAD(P)/FAD-dependent oxidoreductase [Nocardia sp. alder85J]MCX4096731.1 NAD(P)/FAD-dependent oxidoreductase [Nocardia sp. alder85J]